MDDRLVEDTLFLACTRPATVAGVPIEAMGVNIMLTGVVFLAAGDLLYLLIAPVLHLIFRAICKNDHNAFRLLFAFAETKGRARNVRLWGGSSCAPLQLRRRFDLKDLGYA